MDEMKDPITLDFTATQAPAEDAPVGQKALISKISIVRSSTSTCSAADRLRIWLPVSSPSKIAAAL